MRKPVPEYEGLYEVDDLGNIFSLVRGVMMSPWKNKGGYLRVNLFKDGAYTKEYVHRIVAEAFCNRPDGCDYVDHLDGNRGNNSASNLQWVTQQENIRRSREAGHQKKDKTIRCRNTRTGETLVFQCIKYASVALFGKDYYLQYPRNVSKSKGLKVFTYRGWEFEVMG